MEWINGNNMEGNVETNREILAVLTAMVEKYPSMRFTQLLFNVDVNQFADNINPENKDYLLRDPYNDSDRAVLKRIQESSLYKQTNDESGLEH